MRTVHLPAFLVELLREHRERQHHEHVFTAPDDTLLRGSNFRRRVWLPVVTGDKKRGWDPILPELTFHGLRRTHRTWLTEDHVHEVLKSKRMGWRLPGVRGSCDHATQPMIDFLLIRIQSAGKAVDQETITARVEVTINPPTNSETPTGEDHQQGP